MWWKLLTSRTVAHKQDGGGIGTLPRERYCPLLYVFEATPTLLLTHRGRWRGWGRLRRYLHDEEEEEDDKDTDVGVEPGGRAAQARWGRRSGDFGPGEIIKERVDALSGHELHTRQGAECYQRAFYNRLARVIVHVWFLN